MSNQKRYTYRAVVALTLAVIAGVLRSPSIAEGTQDVPLSAQTTHPLMSGKAPTGLNLTTIDGRPFSLDAAIHAHPTILIFYRGGWCPFCNLHLGALQTITPDLNRLGYKIIAISPDPGPQLKETIAKHSLTYTLMTDRSMSVSKVFGLAYQVDAETLAQMKQYGIDLESRTGLHPPLLPVPAAYVLDTAGNIHFAYANPDFRTRVDPDKLLAAAKAAVRHKP
jgi:peroxiredoxin